MCIAPCSVSVCLKCWLQGGWSALMILARNGSHELMQLLLTNNASLNLQNKACVRTSGRPPTAPCGGRVAGPRYTLLELWATVSACGGC